MLTNPQVGQLVRFTREAIITFTPGVSTVKITPDSVHAISKVEHRPGHGLLIELENEDKFDGHWLEEIPGPQTVVVLIVPLEPNWEEVKKQHAEKVRHVNRNDLIKD